MGFYLNLFKLPTVLFRVSFLNVTSRLQKILVDISLPPPPRYKKKINDNNNNNTYGINKRGWFSATEGFYVVEYQIVILRLHTQSWDVHGFVYVASQLSIIR